MSAECKYIILWGLVSVAQLGSMAEIKDLVEGPWACPGLCWEHESYSDMISLEQVKGIRLWNISCENCVNCDYGQWHDGANCRDLKTMCDDVVADAQNRQMIAVNEFDASVTWESLCTNSYFVCSAGLYHDSADNLCKPCQEVNYGCPVGMLPKRCISYAGSDENPVHYCQHCQYPLIENSVKFRYGAGALFAECNSENYLTENCAWFLTPKWEHGWCKILCNSGYVMEPSLRPLSFGEFPTCILCETQCVPGFRPPDCSHGDGYDLHRGKCQQCAEVLPLNALWSSSGHCEWGCRPSYYKSTVAAGASFCAACEASGVACPENQFFMGCKQASSGACVLCDVSCQHGFYLDTSIYLDKCACRSCKSAALGATFIRQNCSLYEDAVLSNCSSFFTGEGGVIVQNGSSFFMKKSCSLYSDAELERCSKPPRPGLYLSSPCSYFSDSVYVECPLNKTCNGTSLTGTCPLGKIALHGICTCGPATIVNEETGDCSAIPCPRGMYADPVLGECSNCTMDEAMRLEMQESNAGKLGIESCRCPPGFFKIQEEFVKCWPCGDLNCHSLSQKQDECDGDFLESVEPTCRCGFPPGSNASSVDSDTCSFHCLKSHQKREGAHSGLYDNFDFSFVVPGSDHYLWNLKLLNLTAVGHDWKDMILLDDEHLLVLSGSGYLFVLNLGPAKLDYWVFNHTDFIPKGNFRSQIGPIHSVIPHNVDGVGMVWVSFSYFGLCELEGDDARKCTAMDLLYFQYSSDVGALDEETLREMGVYCRGPFCIRLGTQVWGKDFSSYGLQGDELHLTFAKQSSFQPGSLMFLAMVRAGSLTVFGYPLKFYAEGDARESDYPIAVRAVFQGEVSSVLSFGFGMGGLFFSLKVHPDREPILVYYSLVFDEWIDVKELFLEFLQWSTVTFSSSQLRGFYLLSEHLMWLSGSSHVMDYSNFFISSESLFAEDVPDTVYLSSRESHFVSKNRTHLRFRKGGFRACPIHEIYYHGASGQCQLSICHISKRGCGAHSVRYLQTGTCGCEPGYALNPSIYSNALMSGLTLVPKFRESVCLPCEKDMYCPGGTSPSFQCPPHSFSNNFFAAEASSVEDCHCYPGYFHFGGQCVLCPTNMWCPFNGTTLPIPCKGPGSTTVFEGASSPLECICDKRRHGIHCVPCDDRNDCVPIQKLSGFVEIPKLFAVHVQGWAPFWAPDLLLQCMKSASNGNDDLFMVYTISNDDFFPFRIMQNVSRALIENNLLFWNWVIVLRGLEVFGSFQATWQECMLQRGFIISRSYNVYPFASVDAVQLRVERSCGNDYWEWSGDMSGTLASCTCIAGYEVVRTIDWEQQCFPCINGTYRARRRQGGCVACSGAHEEAPYLGMSHCVCKSGFARPSPDGACAQISSDIPDWYSVLSSPLIFISVSACICIFVFVVFLVLGIRYTA